jgi:hypothetical protein
MLDQLGFSMLRPRKAHHRSADPATIAAFKKKRDAGKIKWYQGETQQEIDKAKKGLEYLAQQQDKIQKQNEMTKKRLDDVQKNIEERDKYHPN